MKILKTIVTTLIICLTIQANAWDKKIKGNGNVVTENRTTADYEKIAVGGSFDVTLIDGKEGELTIKIEDNLKQYLITEVKDGTLKVQWKKGVNIYTKKGVTITIPFEQINAVSLAGSGNITTKKTISSHDLVLKVAGSGDLDLDVKASDLTAKIAGSGDIRVNVTGSLKARVAGSGDITYKGRPAKEDTKVAGSGSISMNR